MSDDELIGAWLDRELPVERAAEVERRIGSDPAFAFRVRRFQSLALDLAAAHADLLDRPVPPGLGGVLRGSGVVPFRVRVRRLAPIALAAGVALTLGLGTAWLFRPAGGGSALLPAEIFAALDRTSTGVPVRLASGGEVLPMLTFQDHAGHWCREFRVERGADPAIGIACRTEESWQVAALIRDHFTMAGGEEAASGLGATLAAMEPLVQRMIEGEPADLAMEADLIGRGWH